MIGAVHQPCGHAEALEKQTHHKYQGEQQQGFFPAQAFPGVQQAKAEACQRTDRYKDAGYTATGSQGGRHVQHQQAVQYQQNEYQFMAHIILLFSATKTVALVNTDGAAYYS
jgi:hypothetical protein